MTAELVADSNRTANRHMKTKLLHIFGRVAGKSTLNWGAFGHISPTKGYDAFGHATTDTGVIYGVSGVTSSAQAVAESAKLRWEWRSGIGFNPESG